MKYLHWRGIAELSPAGYAHFHANCHLIRFDASFLYFVAAVARWLIWAPGNAVGADIVVQATIITGAARTRWLPRGVPLL